MSGDVQRPATHDPVRAPRVPRRVAIRLLQFSVASSFLLGTAIIEPAYNAFGWWFWVGMGSISTLVFLEPRYTSRASSLVFGLASMGVMFGANQSGVETLWNLYFATAVLITVAALISLAVNEGRPSEIARFLATRLGRPQILGFGALGIEALRVSANVGLSTGTTLVVGVVVSYFASSFDWLKLASYMPSKRFHVGRIEGALEPNVLIVSAVDRLRPGTRVRVSGVGTSTGTTASLLAHRDGPRMQIVLDGPWTDVTDASGRDCVVERLDQLDKPVVAFAVAGSTERNLRLHPMVDLSYGATVYWERDGTAYLYQVSSLALERDSWDTAAVLEARGSAIQLGAVETTGAFDFVPKLPSPYEPLRSAESFSTELDAKFMQVGCISGTQIPFGVDAEALQSHHMAILGMSGMGKTTFALRIIDLVAKESAVIALDGTGEYRSRFEYQSPDPESNFSKPGAWVHEPTGVQSEAAAKYIQKLMGIASTEYQDGTPSPRTLLLEEAHTFLPEWNFNASKSDSTWVAKSCRYILQARKFGLSLVLVSQRTAVISKSALSQCESYVIFRTLDGTSLDYIESVVGPELRQAAASLARYQAICVGPAFSTASGILVDLQPPGNESGGHHVRDSFA